MRDALRSAVNVVSLQPIEPYLGYRARATLSPARVKGIVMIAHEAGGELAPFARIR